MGAIELVLVVLLILLLVGAVPAWRRSESIGYAPGGLVGVLLVVVLVILLLRVL
jgi:hypothetical protein